MVAHSIYTDSLFERGAELHCFQVKSMEIWIGPTFPRLGSCQVNALSWRVAWVADYGETFDICIYIGVCNITVQLVAHQLMRSHTCVYMHVCRCTRARWWYAYILLDECESSSLARWHRLVTRLTAWSELPSSVDKLNYVCVYR